MEIAQRTIGIRDAVSVLVVVVVVATIGFNVLVDETSLAMDDAVIGSLTVYDVLALVAYGAAGLLGVALVIIGVRDLGIAVRLNRMQPTPVEDVRRAVVAGLSRLVFGVFLLGLVAVLWTNGA